MKLKINKKWFTIEYLWFYTIIFLIYIKLTSSYLDVETGWWGYKQEQITNYIRFNFLGLPENFSGKMEFGLIPLIFIYVFIHFNILGRFKISFITILLLLSLNIGTFAFTESSIIQSVEATLRMIGPILFFLTILIFSKKQAINVPKLMIKIFKYCGLLIIIGIVFFDPVVKLNDVRLPIYFSNVHTHSYILTSIFIGMSYFIFKNSSVTKLVVFYFVTVLFLYFGYTVRTALIVYLIYILATLFIRSNIFKEIVAISFIAIPFFVVAAILFFNINFDSFSSGRLSMYVAKFEMLKTYNIVEFFFGRGYGSDIIHIETWAGKKGSHSDYITYAIESGIFYMFTFIFLLLSLIPTYKKINLVYISLIVGYLFSSLISNGIAIRPLAGYLFFIVLAFVYLNIWGEKEGWIKNELNVSN